MTILWESACGCSSDCPCGRRIRELEAALAVYRDAESIWRARVAELEQRLATVTAAFDREIEPREREAD